MKKISRPAQRAFRANCNFCGGGFTYDLVDVQVVEGRIVVTCPALIAPNTECGTEILHCADVRPVGLSSGETLRPESEVS